jgi:hypothetical protein
MIEAALVAAITNGSAGPKAIFFAIIIYVIVQFLNMGISRIKKAMDKTEKIKGIVKRYEADTVIQGLINGALANIGCDRIQVVEFSNGNKNLGLVPFNKMVCTYETFQLGKVPLADHCNGVPTTNIGLFLIGLNKAFAPMALNCENPDERLPSTIYSMIGSRFVTKALYVPIRSPKSKTMIGYISLDSDDKITILAAETATTMRSLAAQIGILLTLGEW